MYFGVTPALILFWPFVALTGHYLFNRLAVTIFSAVGVTVSLGLLRALWRRYFPGVSVWVVAACALALGLVSGLPALLPQSDIYQVAISCGYMLAMLALGAIWDALHEPERRCRWLAAASVAYGLAVGARPSLLFGAVILLVPVVQAWRERRKIWALLTAATGPIILIGLGLMLYNALRFDNPFEFGVRYQLAGQRQVTRQFLSLRYLWFNFRVFFLEPAHWSGRFPFVHDITVPPLPAGYDTQPKQPFGVLANIPLTWLALAAPLAWRGRSGQERGALRWFVTAVALLFGICAVTLGLFWSASFRYEVDFLPALVLLAVVGILGFERALTTPGLWRGDQPVRRHLVRWGWSMLLGCSVVFNVLVSVKNYAYAGCSVGTMLALKGRVPEGIRILGKALRIEPDYAEAHNSLGTALQQTGKIEEAIAQYEQALRIKPDYAEPHYNLGTALQQTGKIEEAIAHYEQALRINPDFPGALNNLGTALAQTGKIEEAIAHYEQALRIKPDDADAHVNLGIALLTQGNARDAMAHYEEALRINPDDAKAHYNLGIALGQAGRVQEATEQWEQALRINPDDAEAHYNLGVALSQAGRLPEAMKHWEQVLRLKPDDVDTHYNLGTALQRQGRVPEAIEQFEQALKLRPDFPAARDALARLRASQ